MKLLLLVLVCITLPISGTSMITYGLCGARLGDHLTGYCKAQWYAYIYRLPLLYKPFAYSDQFALHTIEKRYTDEIAKSFDEIIQVSSENDIKMHLYKKNVLFVVYSLSNPSDLYDCCLESSGFEKRLLDALTPLILIPELIVPEGSISVALHVRKGGGFDQPLSTDKQQKVSGQRPVDQSWPTKFPPDEYYIEQLKVVRRLCDSNKNLEVFLFTDDLDPAGLVEKYSVALNDPTIHFSYRAQGNSHDKNVMEDLFLMAQCECLIRADSFFSRISQLVGNHRIIISPSHGKWENEAVINPVCILINSKPRGIVSMRYGAVL